VIQVDIEGIRKALGCIPLELPNNFFDDELEEIPDVVMKDLRKDGLLKFGTFIGEVLIKAVNFYGFCRENYRSGGKIALLDSDGNVAEVLPREAFFPAYSGAGEKSKDDNIIPLEEDETLE
jgi:hypothetical protein